MKIQRIKIELSAYWHAGSGNAGAGDLDATIVRDRHGLPYLPGRTIKGLFRDAAELWQAWNSAAPATALLFGTEGGMAENPSGVLHFSDANLPAGFTDWVDSLETRKRDVLQGLVETMASTAIDRSGIAQDQSLRKFEAAIPMVLEATISWKSGPDDETTAGYLTQIASLIRRLGSHRHRGYGRCSISTVVNHQ